MKYIYKILLILSIITLFVSCTEEPKDCESADSCSETEQIDRRSNIKIPLNFLDSSFYDQTTGSFREFTSFQILEGNLGQRIPIYVDFVSLSKEDALAKVEFAEIQKDNMGAFLVGDLSTIPYFRLSASTDIVYIFEYKKLDQVGQEVGSCTGQLMLSGGYAYLPLVNDLLCGQFFNSSTGGSQSDFTHRFTIAAQSANTTESQVVTFSFSAQLEIPSRDFVGEYSAAMDNINLNNRWDYFYDANDGVTNTELLLGDMVERSGSDNSTAQVDNKDLRFVFKTKPKIEIVYTLFDEDNLVKDSTDTDANVTIVRGYQFYERSYILDSERDFGLVYKINGVDVQLNDGSTVTNTNADKESILRDVPAGAPWRITFGYDLTQKATYPSGKVLLKPFRPFCNSITKIPYQPIARGSWKSQINSLGGFAAICHPDSLESENSNAENLPSFVLDKVDSFYNYFSYTTSKDISSNTEHVRVRPGHFYGIKSIQFRIEGCLKLFIRDASVNPVNPNPWIQKNEESASCSSGPGDEDWLAFGLNKEISIFDNVEDYSTIPGLKELINNYRNSVPLNDPNFYFNDDNFVEHIH